MHVPSGRMIAVRQKITKYHVQVAVDELETNGKGLRDRAAALAGQDACSAELLLLDRNPAAAFRA